MEGRYEPDVPLPDPMTTPAYGALPEYSELQCASNFSFLRGASHADDLAARAAQLGYSAIAVTDECSLAGVVRAHVEAKKAGIPFIVGSAFALTNADGTPALRFTALAMTRDGYGNLSELITLGRMRADKGSYCLAMHDLDHPDPAYAHLKGLPDCIGILSPDYPADKVRLDAQLEWFAAAFGPRARIALTLHARAMDDIHRGVIEQTAAQRTTRVEQGTRRGSRHR